MVYITRHIESILEQSLRSFKVIFLGGPRQVGKSTVFKRLADTHRVAYISLDDITLRELAQNDPNLFLQQFSPPIVIDEVQYAPQLFPYIKKIVDTSKAPGQFWLTGSQQFSVIKNIQESLAGRVAVLQLLGLSRKEKYMWHDEKKLHEVPKIQSVFSEIFQGGYPVFQLKNSPDRDVYFNSYIQTYLDRDLSDMFGVHKVSEFNRFIQVCAARTGQMLNMSDMARDCGISVTTAIEWLRILESTMQIYLLQPYFPNVTKRIIKAPKLYFLDTGLASYLTKWNTKENLLSGSMAGAIFETYIVSEFLKNFIHNGKQPSMYYMKDKEGHEVDLVIENNGLHLYEIKLSARAYRDHEKNLRYFSSKTSMIKRMSVISLIENPIDVPGGISYVPYTLL